MSENVFPHSRTGIATLTATGFTTTPTVDVTWVRNDHNVTLHLPAFLAVSNAVTLTMTGVPEEILPTQALVSPQVVVDSGANAQGVMLLAADSATITLGEGGVVAGGFTGSGNKGLPGNSLTYLSIPRRSVA